MTLLDDALADAGGSAAPRERSARLRDLLRDELARSERELALPRSGREQPVTVGFAVAADGAGGGAAGGGALVALVALVPVGVTVRVDPDAAPERGFLAAAAAVGALVEIAAPGPPTGPDDLRLEAGALDGRLALRLALAVDAVDADDAELAAIAFDEQAAPIARLRSRAVALPAHVVADAGDWRAPIAHGLRCAEVVARLGGRPASADSVAELEDAALALLAPAGDGATRPHDDDEPARRIARRILQRLRGMGKWGAYHTEFRHLSRGFAGNERALADAVGEALVDAGLLAEKPSVGQRHVFLNPRRAADIHALVDDGALPSDLVLP